MWEQLPEGVGALGVTEVKPGSLAGGVGLQEYVDCILEYEVAIR